MIAPHSYPELFGVADNNGYGWKLLAFLRLDLLLRYRHAAEKVCGGARQSGPPLPRHP
jgi:hypothetical protein